MTRTRQLVQLQTASFQLSRLCVGFSNVGNDQVMVTILPNTGSVGIKRMTYAIDSELAARGVADEVLCHAFVDSSDFPSQPLGSIVNGAEVVDVEDFAAAKSAIAQLLAQVAGL